MDYVQRMNDFAAKCGLPAPETAAGAVVIDFNGIAVSFLDDASGGAIVLHAGIGEALGGSEGAVAREMLAANASLRERQGPILGPSGIGDQNAAAPPPVADDATMLTGLQNFIGVAMLARFGAAKLHAIQEALTGENAADLDTMLVEGARDWFARVDITPEALDEAVMGKGGGKPTEKFKEQIRDHMERMDRSGFAMLQSILSNLLGDDKMKELPDDYKGVIPETFKMIVEDYAKDTRRQLGA